MFHPLIAPLTTYTHTTRDRGSENVSAADDEKLPPGGLTLRHGFPEWYTQTSTFGDNTERGVLSDTASAVEGRPTAYPHIIEVLQYIHVILDSEAVIDSVSLNVAANAGAWHAWRSYRSKAASSESSIGRNRSMSPSKQQPGGARRPGEWNWTGVWEDRVKKAIQASIADATLFGGDGNGQVGVRAAEGYG